MPWLRAELKNEGTNNLFINHKSFRFKLLCSCYFTLDNDNKHFKSLMFLTFSPTIPYGIIKYYSYEFIVYKV